MNSSGRDGFQSKKIKDKVAQQQTGPSGRLKFEL